MPGRTDATAEVPGFAADCPCAQAPCPLRGKCVECVRAHRQHKRHLPECMQDIVRNLVKDLAEKVEYRVSDSRPTPEFWAKQKK